MEHGLLREEPIHLLRTVDPHHVILDSACRAHPGERDVQEDVVRVVVPFYAVLREGVELASMTERRGEEHT